MDTPPFSSLFSATMPSGDVWQRFAASFFSPQVNIAYAGNPAVEREVVGDVASFGRQLGILSDAVLEIAGDAHAGPAVTRLRKLADDVEAVKKRRRASAASEARDALRALDKVDPAALARLLAEFRAKP